MKEPTNRSHPIAIYSAALSCSLPPLSHSLSHTRTHIHSHPHTHRHYRGLLRVNTHTHTHTHAHICIYSHTHTRTGHHDQARSILAAIAQPPTHPPPTLQRAPPRPNACQYTHTHIHIYMHTPTHPHIYTHTHRPPRASKIHSMGWLQSVGSIKS